ncbi:MAG: hypothetical protein WAL90_09540 [Desulfobacterales bacterium]
MADTSDKTTGIQRLIRNLKKEFRIPENLEYYSEEDLQEAEKKYLKFCLQNGCSIVDRAGDNGTDAQEPAYPVE